MHINVQEAYRMSNRLDEKDPLPHSNQNSKHTEQRKNILSSNYTQFFTEKPGGPGQMSCRLTNATNETTNASSDSYA